MSQKKAQLIETARLLFAKHGFHAVGIDTIIKESGVAKKTLYNHFKSKEDLILAVLVYYDLAFRNFFVEQVEKQSGTPKEKLLSIFDVAEAWFNMDDFYGCFFVGASSEFPDMDTPIRDVCKNFKRLMGKYIEQLAVEAKIVNAEGVAAHLVLLLEGAITMAQINGNSFSAKQAKEAAKIIVGA
ncbi:TetR/AcrR family transcriptional regulator [Candidatus Uabimicrobium sp. HlEnr_7]|uniref:TetR/AcrR family transcriptional regulator n=1 Tax=Candidatus Uabimicrobium helgolandensis TaxID=3095367 RepID=UPI0035574724